MELKQRKRIINNIPRFNLGDDAMGTGGNTKDGNIKDGNTKDGNIKDTVYQNAYAVGEMMSLNSKFNDSTSRDIKTYGDTIAKMIPGKYGKAALAAVDLASDTIGMFNYKHSGTEMMNLAGTGTSTVNGISYNTLNLLDTRKAYNDVKGTAIKNAISGGFKGSAAGFALGGGPVGAVIGGLLGNTLGIFAGRKAMIRQKRINRNNAMQTEVLNQDQMAQADTEGLQNNYYAKNYDTTGGILYANRGKDLKLRKRLMDITKV